jgi:hypothetical protein
LWFNRTQYDRIGTHHSPIPNTVWPLYLTAGIQHDIVPNLASRFTAETHVRAESPQPYPLKNHGVPADPPCSNHATDRMGEKYPRPNLALGRDFQPKQNNVQVG